MEKTKSEIETQFEQSVEQLKQEQKQAQETERSAPEYDSWTIELMHWGAHH